MKEPINIAIFASGAGSNAEKIIQYFRHSNSIKIVLVLCNKPGARVLEIAAQNHIESLIINKNDFFGSDYYISLLKDRNTDLIILAGFLWKIPENLIHAFPERIINIHPALLPKYGGKGMYGHFVHDAVIAAHDKESGITIHLVDELYDHGRHLFQATCKVDDNDTAESLAEKIHYLEHLHFPVVIDEYIKEYFK
ncbi:MAG: phosphoribosylglycinamide formyltransferase [Arachidicoccus sp.]|nr:phosphoribosylglycinamide formyltransferase [Arachidicoccus sp.]